MDESANKRTKNDEKDVKIGAAVQTQKKGKPKTVNMNNKSYPAFRPKRMPPENKPTKKQINDELKRENAELKAKVCD